MKKKIFFISGTWEDSEPKDNDIKWWEAWPGSLAWHILRTNDRFIMPGKSFRWPASLHILKSNENVWKTHGRRLAQHVRRHGGRQSIIIAHSHGGQLAKYAAVEFGMEISLLVTLATPSRKDVPIPDRKGIKRWISVHGTNDWWLRWGMVGDLVFSPRKFITLRDLNLHADKEIILPGVSHSDVHSIDVWKKYHLNKLLK